MAVEQVAVVQTKAIYPHGDEIPDFPTRQALRLAWDQIRSLQDRLTAAEATITRLLTAVNTTETSVAQAQRDIQMALAPTQES